MHLSNLSEEYRLPNGLLKGPRVGSCWAEERTTWIITDVSRPTDQRFTQCVTLEERHDHGSKNIKTITVSEFWGLVQKDILMLVVHIRGVEAIKRGIRL
jgi:hypothetical protein